MRTLFTALATLAICTLSSPVFADVVYLKNGEEIECQSYSRQGRSLQVSVNRDVQLEFDVGEVDFKKTPPPARRKQKPVVAATKAAAAVEADPEPEAVAFSDSNSGRRPFFGVPVPEGSTPCSPKLQNHLLQVYDRYNRAAESGSFAEMEKHMLKVQAEGSRKALAGLSRQELQKRKKVMQGLAVKNYRATACMVSPDSDVAVIAGRGRNGKTPNAHGTVSFKKEEDSWKVRFSMWNNSM